VDYRYLDAFLATARRLNFTQAAGDLGVTQAAVSRQIRLLEESLDLQLFVRSPKRVVLTPEGRRLLIEAERLDGWIRTDLKGGVPTLRIAVLQGILENWLPRVIDRHFKSESVNFHIRTGSQEAIDAAVESGEVDLGINSHRFEGETLTSFRLFRERIGVVSKKPVDLDRLADYPWVTLDPNSYLVPLAGKRSRRILQVESINAALSLVASGAGITMLPLHLIARPEAFRVYPVERFGTEFIWATTFNYSKTPDYLKAFVQALRKESEVAQN
jgi:DNA-binding transcriptional LysR family regulator